MSAARHGWAHIRAYCTCGGKLDARSEPPEAAEAVQVAGSACSSEGVVTAGWAATNTLREALQKVAAKGDVGAGGLVELDVDGKPIKAK